MAWFIQEGINNGYPALHTWRETWQTDWTSNGSIRYPDYMWRIKQGINNGYPWIYPWFKESEIDTGELVIGGSQSNYPSGFTGANHGGIVGDFDDTQRIGGISAGGSFLNTVIMSALSNRSFVINGSILGTMLSTFNDTSVFDSNEATLIQKLYGANVFDSIVSCKGFPFDLGQLRVFGAGGAVISSSTSDIKAFGRYTLAQNANLLGSTVGYYFFPVIEVNPLQAWEIESIDYSIFLPMAGLYPLDIRGQSNVRILLMVDLISGTGEYNVYINDQCVGVYRCMLGVDIPINNNQGRMQANMLTNVVSSFSKATGTIAGAVLGGTAGALVGSTLSSVLPVEHYAMSAPSVGGLASIQEYPIPHVIAKVPKMFKDGFGYQQTLGFNRSTTYVHLNECSGFVKCKNYKTDIIVATDTEKLEIERLMNEGVFV